jgi:pimeloyl-ACP methyl ester carboxylesterase
MITPRQDSPRHEDLAHLERAAGLAGVAYPELVLPRSRHCLAGRMRLHYLDWGNAGRPHTLFLHGGCLTAHTWDLVCLALRSELHCLALDQRGHGDSEWSPEVDYRFEAHQRDLGAWIAELGCERPVLVGQSLGAINALMYARAHARELAGVVLVDVAPGVQRSVGARRIGDFTRSAPDPLDSIEEAVARAREFNPRRDPELLRRSLMHNLRERPDGRLTWKYDRRFLALPMAERGSELEGLGAAAAEGTCPVLVVRGAESDVVSAREASDFAARFPRARLVEIAGAGHTVQGDNPRDLLRALREFVAELE